MKITRVLFGSLERKSLARARDARRHNRPILPCSRYGVCTRACSSFTHVPRGDLLDCGASEHACSTVTVGTAGPSQRILCFRGKRLSLGYPQDSAYNSSVGYWRRGAVTSRFLLPRTRGLRLPALKMWRFGSFPRESNFRRTAARLRHALRRQQSASGETT